MPNINKTNCIKNAIAYCKKALNTYGGLQKEEVKFLIAILEGKETFKDLHES